MEFGDLTISEEDVKDAPLVVCDVAAIPDGLPERWEHLLRYNAKVRETWESTKYPSPSEHAYSLMGLAGYVGLTKEEAAAVHVAYYAQLGRKEDGVRKAPSALRAWEKGRQRAEAREATTGDGKPAEREPGEPLPEEIDPSPEPPSQAEAREAGKGPGEKTESVPPKTDASVSEIADETDGVDAFLSDPPKLEMDVVGVRVGGDSGWTSGLPKTMKGLFSLEEARANATGTAFLDHFATRKRRVLYVSEEDRRERLHRRVQAMMKARPPEEIPSPENLRFLVKKGVRLDTKGGLEVLRRTIARHRPELVFLEQFDKMHTKNRDKEEEMKPLLGQLDTLTDKYGCVFRVQKHSKKTPQGQRPRAGELMAGSVALFGWGDSSVYLTLVKRGLAQIEVEAKDGETSGRFFVRFDQGRLVYAGSVETDKKEKRQAEVLDAVTATPGLIREEIASRLKVSPRTAGTYLRTLEEAGMVVGKQDVSNQPKSWWPKSVETEA